MAPRRPTPLAVTAVPSVSRTRRPARSSLSSVNGRVPRPGHRPVQRQGCRLRVLPERRRSTLITTVGNADCGPNAVVCVDIDTIEDQTLRAARRSRPSTRRRSASATSSAPPAARRRSWPGPASASCWSTTGATQTAPALSCDAPERRRDRVRRPLLEAERPWWLHLRAAGQHQRRRPSPNDNVIVDVNLAPTDDNQDGITDPRVELHQPRVSTSRRTRAKSTSRPTSWTTTTT